MKSLLTGVMRRALHQLCRIPPSSLQQRVCGVATIAASPRGKFSMIEDNDLSAFEKILGKNNVLTEDLDPYNTDFLHIYKGENFEYCFVFVSLILYLCCTYINSNVANICINDYSNR